MRFHFYSELWLSASVHARVCVYLYLCRLPYLQKCQGYIEDHADALKIKKNVQIHGVLRNCYCRMGEKKHNNKDT